MPDHMIRRLEERGCTDVSMAGGKGAALARMTALGIPVPPGFVVSAEALLYGLEVAGALTAVAELIARAAGGDAARRRLIAEEIQARVLAVPLCDEAVAAVCDAYAVLGVQVPVAVRSSACCEDSATASCAGVQDTFLQVIGPGAVLESIRACWASFWGERAIAYRAQHGSLTELGIAVVVQRMVAADVAGILFTVDPVAGHTDRMIAEAVFGLGEGAASGRLTPDSYILDRSGRLIHEDLHAQPLAVVQHDGGGTLEEPLAPQTAASATLDDHALRRLAAIGRQLEAELGGPQDIEWAIQDGELFVLQSRPVTA